MIDGLNLAASGVIGRMLATSSFLFLRRHAGNGGKKSGTGRSGSFLPSPESRCGAEVMPRLET